MHVEQMAPVGAPDPQDRLFPTKRACEHAARVRSEDCREQSTGKAQEDEHALGRPGVIPATWSALEMLSMRMSWPDATALTASATALGFLR